MLPWLAHAKSRLRAAFERWLAKDTPFLVHLLSSFVVFSDEVRSDLDRSLPVASPVRAQGAAEPAGPQPTQ